MDNNYLTQLESQLDDMQTRLKALETAVTQIPQINFQADVTRPAGVVVAPAALVVK